MKKFLVVLMASVILFSCGKQPDKEFTQPYEFKMYQDEDSCKRQPDLYWCLPKED